MVHALQNLHSPLASKLNIDPSLSLITFSFIYIFSKPPVKSLGIGADAILSELLKPVENKMASMSRTQQKLALQREHLLKQEKKKKEQERLRQLEQTSEISIPFPRPTETLPPHLPPAVLNVRITF